MTYDDFIWFTMTFGTFQRWWERQNRRLRATPPVFAVDYAVVFEALAICGEYFIVFFSHISYIIVIDSTD